MDPQTIATRLQEALTTRGWSPDDLARTAGVSRSVVVGELLAGVERQRYPVTLARLALALEQPWDYFGAAPPPDTPPGAATNLVRARLERGWTGGELATAAGVSLKTVRDLEAGHASGSPRTWRALAEALGCAVADLTGVPPTPPPIHRDRRRRPLPPDLVPHND